VTDGEFLRLNREMGTLGGKLDFLIEQNNQIAASQKVAADDRGRIFESIRNINELKKDAKAAEQRIKETELDVQGMKTKFTVLSWISGLFATILAGITINHFK